MPKEGNKAPFRTKGSVSNLEEGEADKEGRTRPESFVRCKKDSKATKNSSLEHKSQLSKFNDTILEPLALGYISSTPFKHP